MGSSTINFRTGEPLSGAKYYSNDNINTGISINNIGARIGCAAENECYFNDREYALDEKVSGTQTICGEDNTFVRCTNGAAAIPSEGGTLLCKIDPDEDEEGDGIWDKCTDSTPGTQIDNFICSYNAAENEWQWFSEFSCSPTQKYQVRDNAELPGRARICDGASWLSCLDLADENPFTEPGVEVTCEGSVISVSELQCNNNIDDDNDGLLDCDDRTACSSLLTPILDENNNYEIVVKKGDCFTSEVRTAPIATQPAPLYSRLNVCDLGTEAFGNRVTLCKANAAGTENTPILTLDSTNLLQNRFGQPYVDDDNLAFLFKESSPKTVNVMLARDISTAPLELPLETFAPNFAAGQRIMLVVDEEAYVFWHPPLTANRSFSETNLRLTHIATGNEIPAVVYPGTNRYTFDLVGDRLMTFLIDTPLVDPENQIFRIQALAPGEAPQSFPVPTHLQERFEVQFSKANPVRFINPADAGLGIFSVCRDDNSADPQQVKVCRDNQLAFTLRARDLTKREVTGTNYAFLFEVINSTKRVSIFPVFSLSSASTPWEYDPFINAMVSGRRVAIEFEKKLYLLRHPLQPFISLPSITLTRYSGDLTTIFPAIGSPDLIDFLSSEGKITVQRQYGDPPPPFHVSALRVQDIAPVDLDVDLSTSMSSLVPVTVDGTAVVAADAQYRLDENVFNIMIGASPQLLHFRQPLGQNETLYYYQSASPSGSELVKQVSIYKLYDLSAGSQSRAYNPEFIQALAGGKEFILTFDNGATYYLAGYENNNREVLSFNINRMRLFSLDKSQTFPAIPESGGVRFDLPSGERVRLVVNYGTGQLDLLTGVELLTPVNFSGYMTELTPSTTVIFADGIDPDTQPTELRLHNVAAYADLPSAEVSMSDGAVGWIVEPAGVLSPQQSIHSIEGQPYYFETNGLRGNEKRIKIRRVFMLYPPPLPAFPFTPLSNWFDFVTEVRAGREPLLFISNRLYLPGAENAQVERFTIRAYPGGTPLRTGNLVRRTPISYDGSIIAHDRILHISQQETANEERPVQATLRVPRYYYLPDNREAVRFNSTGTESISFVVAVDGTEYILGTSQLTTPLLLRLSLAAGQNTLLNRLFAAGETRLLNLEGTSVEIKVEAIGPEDGILQAQITVKRQ